ncbi:hypothetical protein RchiOBHm_Chr4g0391561 [Rosa chinensis]|uniref:Uncharacterized protein n=1 Tax=Rosa chinensis TaxID=74649 RepID=A0A2P6QQK9_ROSCH|nr:hypothetical protein RchiOBHm_Chr4g0391561 [Rosa chinensis]
MANHLTRIILIVYCGGIFLTRIILMVYCGGNLFHLSNIFGWLLDTCPFVIGCG